MKPGDCLEPRALRIRRWQAIRDDDIDAMPLSPRHPNPSAATSSANQPTVWRAIFELIASEKVSLYSQSMIDDFHVAYHVSEERSKLKFSLHVTARLASRGCNSLFDCVVIVR
jgi:hypothetical protein